MALPRPIKKARRRFRCMRRGHKWYAVQAGEEPLERCMRCGKETVRHPAHQPTTTDPAA